MGELEPLSAADEVDGAGWSYLTCLEEERCQARRPADPPGKHGKRVVKSKGRGLGSALSRP